MSKPSRGQKCTCSHPRIRRNLNAGACNGTTGDEEHPVKCKCGQFHSIRTRQMRLKDSHKKEKKAE